MGAAESLEREVARRAREAGLLAPGDAVLVAASAGADSSALAGLLAAAAAHGLPLRLVLGHVDHGWRGPEEAAADLEVVRRLATRLSLALATEGPPVNVRRTEDDARRFRYRALACMATAHGCARVATAHHLRDQAETFLLRLTRGSGPAGLAGIPPRRLLAGGPLEVVRPLLWVVPGRLRAYAEERGLPWREDPTNAEIDRDRVRLRARLLALGERGSALTRDLARAADRFARALARREREVATRIGPSTRLHPEAGAVEVSLADVAALPDAATATVLRVLGRSLAADAEGPWFSGRHVEMARDLVRRGADGSMVPLPRGLDLVRAGRRLILARREVPEPAQITVRTGERAEVRGPGGTLRVEWREEDGAGFDRETWARERAAAAGRPPWLAAFDAEALGPSVTFRGVRAGDRFQPLGRDRESEVREFLGRQGLPTWIRRGARVAVARQEAIAWVVGQRIDARFAVRPESRRVAILRVEWVPRASAD